MRYNHVCTEIGRHNLEIISLDHRYNTRLGYWDIPAFVYCCKCYGNWRIGLVLSHTISFQNVERTMLKIYLFKIKHNTHQLLWSMFIYFEKLQVIVEQTLVYAWFLFRVVGGGAATSRSRRTWYLHASRHLPWCPEGALYQWKKYLGAPLPFQKRSAYRGGGANSHPS